MTEEIILTEAEKRMILRQRAKKKLKSDSMDKVIAEFLKDFPTIKDLKKELGVKKETLYDLGSDLCSHYCCEYDAERSQNVLSCYAEERKSRHTTFHHVTQYRLETDTILNKKIKGVISFVCYDNKIIDIRVRLMKRMNTIAPLVEVSTWGHSSGSGFYTKPDLKDLRTRLYQSILSYINQAHDAIYHHEQQIEKYSETINQLTKMFKAELASLK